MLAPRNIRPLLFALVATCGLALTASPVSAGGCLTCTQPCVDCPPNDCDCPCSCEDSKPNNLIYKTLDKVAGGIEKLLGLDKLNCDSCCDGGGCDDCCDADYLPALPMHGHPGHHGPIHHGPIHHGPSHHGPVHHGPSHHGPIQNAPVLLPQAPPASIIPYLESYKSKTPGDQLHVPEDSGNIQDHQWLGQPPMPSSGAPLGTPPPIEPEVIEPAVIDPPIHPQEELTNPFQDDVKVSRRSMVRPARHERARYESGR